MTDTTKRRLLVVDDEVFIRESVSDYFEDLEYDVVSAESGEDALELLEKYTCDVAIVDLRLPEISGETLILKIHKKYPFMHFLIYTGSVGYTPTDELLAMGMSSDQIFFKPLPDMSVMAQRLKQILRGREE